MKTRDGVIEYQKTLDDAGTLIKDINVRDPVSAFYLEFEATNETTSNKGNFISDIITKIEIVDGSEVLYNLNLMQLETLHFLKTGKMPRMYPSEWASGKQMSSVLLMFGKHLYDLEYAMDFTKFDNPQLKITTNIAAIRAIGSNVSFATGTIKGTIVAKIMEDVSAPTKYLMAKQIENWTSATGEKRVNMPRDYPYRTLLARAYYQTKDIYEIWTDLKLTCDTDAFIAFNRKVAQLTFDNEAMFGRGEIKHDVYAKNAQHIRAIFNSNPMLHGTFNEGGVTDFYLQNAPWSSDIYPYVYVLAGTAEGTDRKFMGIESGALPHAILAIPFGLADTPSTWFNPRPYGKVELVPTEGVASCTCEVALEQERTL